MTTIKEALTALDYGSENQAEAIREEQSKAQSWASEVTVLTLQNIGVNIEDISDQEIFKKLNIEPQQNTTYLL